VNVGIKSARPQGGKARGYPKSGEGRGGRGEDARGKETGERNISTIGKGKKAPIKKGEKNVDTSSKKVPPREKKITFSTSLRPSAKKIVPLNPIERSRRIKYRVRNM